MLQALYNVYITIVSRSALDHFKSRLGAKFNLFINSHSLKLENYQPFDTEQLDNTSLF